MKVLHNHYYCCMCGGKPFRCSCGTVLCSKCLGGAIPDEVFEIKHNFLERLWYGW